MSISTLASMTGAPSQFLLTVHVYLDACLDDRGALPVLPPAGVGAPQVAFAQRAQLQQTQRFSGGDVPAYGIIDPVDQIKVSKRLPHKNTTKYYHKWIPQNNTTKDYHKIIPQQITTKEYYKRIPQKITLPLWVRGNEKKIMENCEKNWQIFQCR